jgi:hypothetical protein
MATSEETKESAETFEGGRHTTEYGGVESDQYFKLL